MAASLLSVDGLSVWRDDKELISNLSFSLNAGEIMLVRGRNGGGKTSLLRTLMGFLYAESGDICWRGQATRSVWSDFTRELLYIGHDTGVKHELTAHENLRFSLDLAGATPRCSIDEALSAVGLSGYEDQGAARLSAGQKRRIALAKLFLFPATLWILDEPFTALDADGQALIEQRLIDHARSGGVALVTTHQHMQMPGIALRELQVGRI